MVCEDEPKPRPSTTNVIEDTFVRDNARKAYILKEYGPKPSAVDLINAENSFNAGWEFHRLWEKEEQKPKSIKYRGELWNADPNCAHNVVCAPGGGVKCTKCNGWVCY